MTDLDRIDTRLVDIRGSASTPDAGIVVQTDIHGNITDLFLSNQALNMGPHRLAELIIDRQRAALARATAEAERICGAAGGRHHR